MHGLWKIPYVHYSHTIRTRTPNTHGRYGTLLGQKRHGGLIPWDDDMDSIMRKDDFEKIRAAVEKNNPDIGITPTDGTSGYGGRMFAKLYYKERPRIPGGPFIGGKCTDSSARNGEWGYSWPFLDVFMLIEKVVDGKDKVIRKSGGAKEW